MESYQQVLDNVMQGHFAVSNQMNDMIQRENAVSS